MSRSRVSPLRYEKIERGGVVRSGSQLRVSSMRHLEVLTEGETTKGVFEGGFLSAVDGKDVVAIVLLTLKRDKFRVIGSSTV